MLERIKSEFPELYTKTGKFSKKEPKRYKCECGHTFNRTKNKRIGGIGFGFIVCEECGEKGKRNEVHGIWKRMINNQIEQEDFLLKTIKEHKEISKETLSELATKEFEEVTREALGSLCYFGYLMIQKKNVNGVETIHYSIKEGVDTESRYQTLY